MIDTTLLDSKEPITMDVLQAFFQANDFSTMVSRYDAETATIEDNEFYLKVKKIFQDAWNKEMGALTKKNSLMNFSQFYPIRCLEEREEDLYWRLDTITDEEPKNLFFSTEEDDIGNMESGMEKHLNNFLDRHPDTKLIVIDTLQLARGNSKESNYVNDYADTRKFKQIADKRKVVILLVHHLRKMPDPDPVNMLSGSTGLSGGVAANFIMHRSPQEEVTRLFCKGRHIKPRVLEMRFDETACVWEKISDSRETENKLPTDLRVLLDFMQERLQFSGTNTGLARLLTLHGCKECSPKGLKQLMNKWQYVLKDCGVSFQSHRSKGQRFVDVSYTPPEARVTVASSMLACILCLLLAG